MYLNCKNIELIERVKGSAHRRGQTFAQTNSRLNGHFLSACRIYAHPEDKGHTNRVLWTGRTERDFADYLAGMN